MGFLKDVVGYLKAEKQEKKITNAVSMMSQPPQDDVMKAYIPNFLYKPPFGYPLNKNMVLLKDMAKNGYIFSVIRTLKDEAMTTKFNIRVKKEFSDMAKDNDEDIKRISQWFYNPNGNEESFSDIVGQWVVDLCEVDAAVGVKVFNKKQEFSQLFARDGGSFLKNPDIYGYIGGRDDFVMPLNLDLNASADPMVVKQYASQYSYNAAYFQYGWTGAALPVPFGKREIIYISMNSRSDSVYGRSPLEVLNDTLLTLIYGQQYNLDFYLNGNAPEGIINLQGAEQDIAEVFQQRLSNKFRIKDGFGNERRIGHRYPVYGGPGVDFVPFQLSSRDMQILEQQKWFIKLVWASFGVPPDEMGFVEDSNKAVSQTQASLAKRKALKPILKKIEYAVNTQLMPELDPTGVLEFAFEDYDLDEDIKLHSLYEAQIRMGIKTAEMVAEEEGIDLVKLKKSKEEFRKENESNVGSGFSFAGRSSDYGEVKAEGLKADTVKKDVKLVKSDLESYFKSVRDVILDRMDVQDGLRDIR